MKKGFLLVFVTALLALAAVPAHAADDAWKASYWNNMKFSGAPVITQSESALRHNWKGGSPIPGTISADRFSVRWTRTVSFTAGQYLFRATSDDGIRVWVDGNQIINQWDDHPMQTVVVPLDVTAGDHTIRVDYYENRGDAIAILKWAQVKANAWKVDYYKGTALKGTPVTRHENVLKYYWNAANPVPGVRANDFSARWTQTRTLPAGRVRFKVTANGGFRLYLDNELILDQWYSHGGQASSVKVRVSAGDHRIRLEYYSGSQPARLILGVK